MKIISRLFIAALVLAASSGWASADLDDAVVTGAEARRIYDSLPGPVHGPYCTGACVPGQPCDPPCFYNKEDSRWRCSRTRYTRSGREVYRCNSRTGSGDSALDEDFYYSWYGVGAPTGEVPSGAYGIPSGRPGTYPYGGSYGYYGGYSAGRQTLGYSPYAPWYYSMGGALGYNPYPNWTYSYGQTRPRP